MFFVKIHKSQTELIAICDADLLGKTFSEGRLKLKVSEHFYKGKEKSGEEVEKIMKEESDFNLVGEKTIKLALKVGLIDQDCIITIQGVPHAQIISC